MTAPLNKSKLEETISLFVIAIPFCGPKFVYSVSEVVMYSSTVAIMSVHSCALKRYQKNSQIKVFFDAWFRVRYQRRYLSSPWNEFIRGTAQVRQIGDKVREARLRWYGYMQRRNAEYIDKRMLCLELPGKRRRGRPKTRFMDVVREDMRVVGVSDRDAASRRNWRLRIRCGDP